MELTVTRQRHICTSCHRLLPAYDFHHNGRSGGGWVDAEGIRRRSECRTCKHQRDNSRNHGVPFEPVAPNLRDVLAFGTEPEHTQAARVSAEPFAVWLERKHRLWLVQGGTNDDFARKVGLNIRGVERYLRREYATVRWAFVDKILVNEGSTDLWELYPDLYPRSEAA